MKPAPTPACKPFASAALACYQGPAQLLDLPSGPPESRTPDPLIKSQLLYQLS